jgi:hypothetical protein
LAKFRTHYDNLKVARDAPVEVIHAAYRTLSRKYHPDTNQDDPKAAEIMAIINASYRVLSDPEKRREHDVWIAGREQSEKAAIWNTFRTEPRTAGASPPPPDSTAAGAKPAPRPAPGRSRIMSHFSKFWFFYFLLALVAVGYFSAFNEKEETAYRPPVKYAAPQQPRYIRPQVADNGQPWPQASGYISGYPVRSTDGGSRVTVDNGNTKADMFVKLFNLDEPAPKAVRAFLVKAGDQYTVRNIRQGRYDVRYKNLNTGDRFCSEPFMLQELPNKDGAKYSVVRISLYRGHAKIRAIGEADFAGGGQ